MAAKKIAFDDEARRHLERGVVRADAVKDPGAKGPRGLEEVGAPLISKDGVTVAKEIELGTSGEHALSSAGGSSRTNDDT